MRVTLGKFARSGIESQLGTDLAETVKAAVCHYTSKLESSGRPPVAPPSFFDISPNSGPRRKGEEIELSLDSRSEAVLRREAFRRRMDVDALAAHSVMVYLAEIDFISSPSRTA